MDDAKPFIDSEVGSLQQQNERVYKTQEDLLMELNRTIELGFTRLEAALLKVCEKMDMNHARDRYENSKKEVSITTEIRELQQQVQQLMTQKPPSYSRPPGISALPVSTTALPEQPPHTSRTLPSGPRPSVPIRNPFFNDNTNSSASIVNRRSYDSERHNSLSSVEEATHFAPPASPIATPHPPTSLGGPSTTSKPSLFNRRPLSSPIITTTTGGGAPAAEDEGGFQTNRPKNSIDLLRAANITKQVQQQQTNLPSSPLPTDHAVPPRKGQLFVSRNHEVDPVKREDTRSEALQALEAEKARLSQERERKERFEAKTKELLNSLISPKEQSKLFDEESQEGGLFD